MDFRLAEPTFEEAKDTERDSDEIIIGLQCHGCDYQLWTQIRKGVPTEIKCFRVGCHALIGLTASSYTQPQ